MALPLMAEDEFVLARQHLEEALNKARTPTQWGSMPTEGDLYALLADNAVQQRDETALRKFAPLLEEWALRNDHKLYQAIAHRAWGVAHTLAGQFLEAAERLDRALRLFEALNTRGQIGRTLNELAELALARKEPAMAHEYFSLALTAFEEIGAMPDATRTRARLTTGRAALNPDSATG